MSRTSWILGPLAAVLVLGLTAWPSFAQPAVIIGPPTVVPVYTAPSPVAYVSPPTVSYYAAPAPVVVAPTPLPPVVTTYYAPAPVVTYSYPVVGRRPRVVRYYYSSPVYIYP